MTSKVQCKSSLRNIAESSFRTPKTSMARDDASHQLSIAFSSSYRSNNTLPVNWRGPTCTTSHASKCDVSSILLNAAQTRINTERKPSDLSHRTSKLNGNDSETSTVILRFGFCYVAGSKEVRVVGIVSDTVPRVPR